MTVPKENASGHTTEASDAEGRAFWEIVAPMLPYPRCAVTWDGMAEIGKLHTRAQVAALKEKLNAVQ